MNSKVIIIGLVIFLVILIGLVIYFAVKANNKVSPTEIDCHGNGNRNKNGDCDCDIGYSGNSCDNLFPICSKSSRWMANDQSAPYVVTSNTCNNMTFTDNTGGSKGNIIVNSDKSAIMKYDSGSMYKTADISGNSITWIFSGGEPNSKSVWTLYTSS